MDCEMILHLFTSLSEFKRDVISDRTKPDWKQLGSGSGQTAVHLVYQKAKYKARLAESLYQENNRTVAEIWGFLSRLFIGILKSRGVEFE